MLSLLLLCLLRPFPFPFVPSTTPVSQHQHALDQGFFVKSESTGAGGWGLCMVPSSLSPSSPRLPPLSLRPLVDEQGGGGASNGARNGAPFFPWPSLWATRGGRNRGVGCEQRPWSRARASGGTLGRRVVPCCFGGSSKQRPGASIGDPQQAQAAKGGGGGSSSSMIMPPAAAAEARAGTSSFVASNGACAAPAVIVWTASTVFEKGAS